MMRRILLILVVFAFSPSCPGPSGAREIVYESEYQVLVKQHGEKWASEDLEIEARLDALREKHGKRPNIIYIMWDDMKYGAIGHAMFNKVTGYTSPNINKLAARG